MMLEKEKRRDGAESVVESVSGAEDEYFDRRGEGL